MQLRSSAPHGDALLQAALFAAVQVPRRAECVAAIHAALEAGADVNSRDAASWTPLHTAACNNTDAAAVAARVETLVAAGGDVRARTDRGFEPLHLVAFNFNAKASVQAAIQALLAAGADALAKEICGRTPLFWALNYNNSQASEALLAAMPTEAALKDLCSTVSDSANELLPAFIAARLPLTGTQWSLIPVAPLPGLARALPAALACSGDQARQLVRRLPPLDAKRLRTGALCLAGVQRRMPLWPQQHLPPAIVERILCSALADS